MFAGRCGMNIMLDDLCRGTQSSAIVETLFNEELGAVRLLWEHHPICESVILIRLSGISSPKSRRD